MAEDEIKNRGELKYLSQAIIDRLQNTIKDEDLLQEILTAMLTPSQYYFLRLNLTRINTLEEITPLKFLHRFNTYFSKECDIESVEQYTPLINILRLPNKPTHTKLLEIHRNIVYCDKFAAEAVNIGADLFVPGVTQIPHGFVNGEKVSVFMDPKELHKKKAKNVRQKVNFSYYLLDGTIDPRFHVCNGIARMSTKEITKVRKGIFIENIESKYPTPSYRTSPFYEQGFISDQTFPANLAMAILSHHIHEEKLDHPVIYDTCAAPGHKTSALCEWLYFHKIDGKSIKWDKIIAVDRSVRRFQQLKTDIERLGLNRITIIPQSLEEFVKDPSRLESADYVVFDPPCSALGNRGKLFIEKSHDELEGYFRNQRRLLKVVDAIVKPGGTLMYNTCTIPIEENESIVEYALRKLHYTVLPISDKFKKLARPGIPFQTLVNQEDLDNLLRFYPWKDGGTGYFIALLKKKRN